MYVHVHRAHYALYTTLPDNVCTMYIVLDIHYYTPDNVCTCTLYSLYTTLPDNVCTLYIILTIHYTPDNVRTMYSLYITLPDNEAFND